MIGHGYDDVIVNVRVLADMGRKLVAAAARGAVEDRIKEDVDVSCQNPEAQRARPRMEEPAGLEVEFYVAEVASVDTVIPEGPRPDRHP
jgi:hypothetical protein